MNGPASFISPCNAGPSTFFQLRFVTIISGLLFKEAS